MAVKTVGAQGYDAVMALNAVTASTAAVQTTNNSPQSFGDALNKASDKVTDKIADNAQTDTKTAAKPEQQKTQVSENTTSEEDTEKTDVAQSEQKVTEDNPVDSDKSDVSDVKADNAAQNVEEEEEPIDKMTIEQIAGALMQIIQQLKDLCGVSDAEILAGMKNLDMVPTDLFDANAMTQLLTEIAGEGEVMSLVTNEDLYATLQTLTETAETVSSQLLEDMGLTQDEFDAMLAKLNQSDDAFEEILMPQEEMTETVNNVAQEEVPVVLVEENEKPKDVKELESQVAQKQFDNVADAQQKEVVETQAKPQSQKSERDTHEQKHNANDFNGQQGTQNFDSKLDEAQAVAETATRYTSESTESILRQLADLVKIVKNENLTQMELQLHPASLGTVNVSLVTKGGAVTAEFTTQNEAVRAAIESQVSQLMANLEEQGVKVEAVEVSVASHQMERNLDDNNRDEQSKKEQEEKQRVQGARRNSINFNAFSDDEEMIEELQGADDATRIAMEMMAANGNSMDLMA